jgi:hypothetical protein
MIVCMNAFLNPFSPCYLVYCRSNCLLHKTHAGMNILYYHIETFFKKKCHRVDARGQLPQ